MMKFFKNPMRVALSLLLSLGTTILLYQLLDRRPILEIKSVLITPNPAIPGEPITITWQAKEFRNCDGVVTRRITDSANRVFEFGKIETAYHDALTKGSLTFSRELILPREVAAGTAVYRAQVDRWCNWVQKNIWPIHETPETIKFAVGNRNATSTFGDPFGPWGNSRIRN